jgi:peptidyl-dipeptidase A
MRSVFDQLKVFDKTQIFDEQLYRQVKLLSSIGPSALPADQLDRVGNLRHF